MSAATRLLCSCPSSCYAPGKAEDSPGAWAPASTWRAQTSPGSQLQTDPAPSVTLRCNLGSEHQARAHECPSLPLVYPISKQQAFSNNERSPLQKPASPKHIQCPTPPVILQAQNICQPKYRPPTILHSEKINNVYFHWLLHFQSFLGSIC